MKPSPHYSPLKEWNLLGAMIILALLARILYVSGHNCVYDDAYITLRYADHLIQGHGYVYNQGDPVFGASSPLYTFLMAGFGYAVSKDLMPAISQWMGGVCLFLSVIVFWKFLPLPFAARTVMAIGLLGSPRIFYSSVGGMEECLTLLLMAFSVAAFIRHSQVLQGVIYALLIMTKADTIVWIGAVVIGETILEKRIPWCALLVGGVLIAPWTLYSISEFGSVFPHTVAAKQVASAGSGINMYDAILLPVPDGFRGNLLLVIIFAVIGYGSIGGALWFALRKKEFLFVLFPAYCLAYTVVLFASQTPLGLWARWTIPLWASLVVCFSYSTYHIMNLIRIPIVLRIWHQVYVWSLITLLFGLMSSFVYPRRTSPDPVISRDIGEWLRDNSTASESVFLEPIGLIGYISDLYVHDFVGLVSPAVTAEREKWTHSNRWFTEYIEAHFPSYVVLRVIEIQQNEFMFGGSYGDGIFTDSERKWFVSNYKVAYESTRGPNSEWLVIYKKESGAILQQLYTPS